MCQSDNSFEDSCSENRVNSDEDEKFSIFISWAVLEIISSK